MFCTASKSKQKKRTATSAPRADLAPNELIKVYGAWNFSGERSIVE